MMVADLVARVHSSVERVGWPPWLQFSEDEMRALAEVFPDGQLVEFDEDGRPVAALSTVLVTWDGRPSGLGSWDEVAGRTSSIAESHDPDGTTLVLLSTAVRPERTGQGLASALVDRALELARRLGLHHVIGPIRPSSYGAAKAEGSTVSFAEHCAAVRPDGLPSDPWLRVMRRRGAFPLKVAPAAMVVRATAEEVAAWRASTPERWHRIDAPVDFSDEIGLGEDERIEVWECGETGTWFVDVAAGRATYIEDNLWGEVPIEADAPWRPWVVPSHDARIDSTTSRDSVARLVAEARAVAPGEEGVAVWMDTRHPAGDVIRSLEAEIFPDVMRYLTPAVERRCRLLAVLDLRDEGSLMHCFRVSAHHFEPGDIDPGSSGLAMVDEVIDENPGITLEQVVDHYAARGVDLRRCIAVETSFRVRPGSSPNGMRWSDVGYLAIAREVLERTTSGGAHGIFGHMNQATLRSLAAIGVELEPFCGDESIRSPASRVGATEDRFWPLFVPETPGNLDVFRVLTTLAIPSVVLEPVIDLRDSAPSPLSFEVVPVEDDVG